MTHADAASKLDAAWRDRGSELDAGMALTHDAFVGVQVADSCTQPAPRAQCEHGLCVVHAGCFLIGARRDETYRAAEADVQAEVRLTHDFRIGETEVTLADWRAVGFDDPTPDWTRTGSPARDVPAAGYSECRDPECPVVWINYEDAMAYTNKLSEKEGLKPCYLLSDCINAPGTQLRCHSVRVDAADPYTCEGYRLPTESEWEYAARAGTTTEFYSGPMVDDVDLSLGCRSDPNLDAIGWYCGNGPAKGLPEAGSGRPYPVKQKRANRFGLYDVSGNVFEWVNDVMDPVGYGAGPFVDPVFGLGDPSDLTPRLHPTFGETALDSFGYPGWRSVRGGAYDLWSFVAKSSWRSENSVGGQSSGFRIARTITGGKK